MSSTQSDFDALLVDWLYGELAEAEAERFEEYLATHPEARAEAESLKQTRAAFQDLGDAEPTHSLSAILMREAALAARPQETLWSRIAAFFQPLILHPAASAVATIILLCGVAGSLYLAGDGPKLAEPQGDSQARAPVGVSSLEAARDPAAPGTVQPEQAELGRGFASADGDSSFGIDLAGAEREQAIANAQQPAAEPAPLRKNRKEAQKGEGTARAQADKKDSAKAALDESYDYLRPESDSARTAARRSGRDDLKPAPAEAEAEEKKAEKAWEEVQNQNLKLAARSKRCQEVGRIANDILDKNSTFYKKEVENSQAAEDCRYYIASETERRVKTRQKRAAARAKAKQGNSVPPKALASPSESRDADSADAL